MKQKDIMKEFNFFLENVKSIIERNIFPPYMRNRKRSVIVFDDFEGFEKVNKNFEISFFKKDLQNKKVLEIFLSKPYNIILGDREFFKRVYTLEVFFKYRTDIVVPFLLDDFDEMSLYRSTFNSYVYPENPYIKRFYVMDYKGNSFVRKGLLKNVENFDNLYIYNEGDYKLYFCKKGENESFEIFTYPFYSFENFLIFKRMDLKNFAFPKRCFEMIFEKNVDGVLNVNLLNENNLLVTFYKNDSKKIESQMKEIIKKFFVDKRLEEKNFSFEMKKLF